MSIKKAVEGATSWYIYNAIMKRMNGDFWNCGS